MKIRLNLNESKLSKHELTGRVIYFKGENVDEEYYLNNEKYSLDFNCGPETKDGGIDDSDDFGIYPQLEKLFVQNNIEVEIGASENIHDVIYDKNQNSDEIWNKVSILLEKSGVIKMDD